MVTSQWRHFGTSVRGPGHVRACMPNQDAFHVDSYKWGDVAVVSDGVGSCPTSEHGSSAACRAVVESIESWTQAEADVNALLGRIYCNWLKWVKPFKPRESAATCLFAFRPVEGNMIFGMLGDGLIAILKNDGSYVELCDDKEDCFSNQTSALSAETEIGQWCVKETDQEECAAVLLCTDGIADDLLPERREGFVRWIFEKGRPLPLVSMIRETRKMLENWPTPKHTDDKTIVCLFRREDEL